MTAITLESDSSQRPPFLITATAVPQPACYKRTGFSLKISSSGKFFAPSLCEVTQHRGARRLTIVPYLDPMEGSGARHNRPFIVLISEPMQI